MVSWVQLTSSSSSTCSCTHTPDTVPAGQQLGACHAQRAPAGTGGSHPLHSLGMFLHAGHRVLLTSGPRAANQSNCCPDPRCRRDLPPGCVPAPRAGHWGLLSLVRAAPHACHCSRFVAHQQGAGLFAWRGQFGEPQSLTRLGISLFPSVASRLPPGQHARVCLWPHRQAGQHLADAMI